jgi:O-acetylhomoserine/O-acetylserine sulfhydrylase-like pyridoxal-dependent enzyme
VLERRVAALEGGVEALCVSTGQAALNYALLNVTELGCNIVSVPQLYGTTHTLFAHVFPRQGVSVRFAAGDQPADIDNTVPTPILFKPINYGADDERHAVTMCDGRQRLDVADVASRS